MQVPVKAIIVSSTPVFIQRLEQSIHAHLANIVKKMVYSVVSCRFGVKETVQQTWLLEMCRRKILPRFDTALVCGLDYFKL